MAKRRIIYLVFLAGVFVFHLYYFAWFSWYVLVLALALPIFSLLVSLPAIFKARLEIFLTPSVSRGGKLYLSIHGGSNAPDIRFRLAIQEKMTGTMSYNNVRLFGDRHEATIVPVHCGGLTCQVDRARAYDYLGLFSIPIRLPARSDALVMPVPEAPKELPNLAFFKYRSYHPKNGGGFSEIHDMRDYCPGDSLRDIHWKLSVKTDRLIVREPQEPDKGLVLLTFDLQGPLDRLDSTLDQLMWLSNWLSDQEVEHQVRWLNPRSLEVCSQVIGRREDLEELLKDLLQKPIGANMPSISSMSFSGVSWRCHVGGRGDEDA